MTDRLPTPRERPGEGGSRGPSPAAPSRLADLLSVYTSNIYLYIYIYIHIYACICMYVCMCIYIYIYIYICIYIYIHICVICLSFFIFMLPLYSRGPSPAVPSRLLNLLNLCCCLYLFILQVSLISILLPGSLFFPNYNCIGLFRC